MSRRRRIAVCIAVALATVLTAGYAVPVSVISPVASASIEEINPESFWYYPWGSAGAHRGIDIFCRAGTVVVSPVTGFVYRIGFGSIAGHYVYIIGPRWRSYYFAHLDTVLTKRFHFVTRGARVGRVGTTGNAAGKAPHLHYSIRMLFPQVWHFNSNEIEAWSKIFYLDPVNELGFDAFQFERRAQDTGSAPQN